jgi:hypothetical protein
MSELGQHFYQALIRVADNLGLKPEDLLLIFVSESGLKANEVNSIGAVGLTQLLPSTLKDLGFSGSSKDFSKLSATEQLDWVQKYFEQNFKWLGKIKDPVKLYLSNFVPAAFSLPGIKAGYDGAVIAEDFMKTRGSIPKIGNYNGYADISAAYEQKIYDGNKAFDYQGKGKITYGDIKHRLDVVRASSVYQKALTDLQNSNSSSSSNTAISESKVSEPPTKELSGLDQMFSEMKKELNIQANTPTTLSKVSYIRKVDNKYLVVSEKGKNMGTYPSRAQAKNRLKQVEFFKHKDSNKVEDKQKSIDLSDVEELSYSAIMREAKKKEYFSFINDFVIIYKKIADAFYLKNLNMDGVMENVFHVMSKKYKIITTKKEAAVDSPLILGKAIADVILFLATKVKTENRRKAVSNFIRNIYYLNFSELASMDVNAGAAAGQVITLIKTILRSKDVGFIRSVVGEVIKNLSYFTG